MQSRGTVARAAANAAEGTASAAASPSRVTAAVSQVMPCECATVPKAQRARMTLEEKDANLENMFRSSTAARGGCGEGNVPENEALYTKFGRGLDLEAKGEFLR